MEGLGEVCGVFIDFDVAGEGQGFETLGCWGEVGEVEGLEGDLGGVR